MLRQKQEQRHRHLRGPRGHLRHLQDPRVCTGIFEASDSLPVPSRPSRSIASTSETLEFVTGFFEALVSIAGTFKILKVHPWSLVRAFKVLLVCTDTLDSLLASGAT